MTGAVLRDVVDAVFVGEVVEALELAERAVLIVEEHAGVGRCGVPQVLDCKARRRPVGVGVADGQEVQRDGRADADLTVVLIHAGVAQIDGIDEFGQEVDGAGGARDIRTRAARGGLPVGGRGVAEDVIRRRMPTESIGLDGTHRKRNARESDARAFDLTSPLEDGTEPLA